MRHHDQEDQPGDDSNATQPCMEEEEVEQDPTQPDAADSAADAGEVAVDNDATQLCADTDKEEEQDAIIGPPPTAPPAEYEHTAPSVPTAN